MAGRRRIDVTTRTVILAAVVIVFAIVLIIVRLGQNPRMRAQDLSWPRLILDPADRLLILAPHPDDEVLGCGGIVQQAVGLGLPVRIVFLTYGDFYEWSFIRYKKRLVLTPRGVKGMGEIRRGEAVAADTALGVPAADLTFLGYPDFGTLTMWERAWGPAPPVRGRLSRATAVPYPDAYRPGAPYRGDEVLQDLTAIMRSFRPTKVLVSHPADHHPDHRALYLFTCVALFDCKPEVTPEIYPYLVHYTEWPRPLGRRPDVPLVPPAFLADSIAWQIIGLDAGQESLKADALKNHQTQYKTTPNFLDSFVRRNELFGDFPPLLLSGHPLVAPQGSNGPMDRKPATEEERAHLVGAVRWASRIEGEDLVFSVGLMRPLAREVGCSVYLFGYRDDTPFPRLPKLHLALGEFTTHVYDGGRKIPDDGIQVRCSGRDISIRVPLATLGRPDKILATAQLHAGPIPLEWTAWRILETEATTPGN
jgi:LmbE family N-acetylglucosaminyl deacetylase